jgi:hypothetical protein
MDCEGEGGEEEGFQGRFSAGSSSVATREWIAVNFMVDCKRKCYSVSES